MSLGNKEYERSRECSHGERRGCGQKGMLRHSGKSLVCQAEVWILLKSREAEGDWKAQLSETRTAE